MSAPPERSWPTTPQGNGIFNAPLGAPLAGSFNAAPTIANAPSNPWLNGVAPAGSRPFATPAVAPVAPLIYSYTQQSQQAFPTPPAVPTTDGYVGLTQSQQPFPTTPPLLPQVQAEQISGSLPPDNPFAGVSQAFDTAGERKRLRRNGLRPNSNQRAFSTHTSGEASPGMVVVSDPYLRSMLNQYSQEGQPIKQAPEES